ncbi:hypothetical protein ACRYCC_37840 [Actinomadura scrupuli]
MKATTKRTLRRLGQAAMYSAVRAGAAAAGTAGFTALMWWIHH